MHPWNVPEEAWGNPWEAVIMLPICPSVLHGQWQGFLGCLQHRPCVSLPLVHVSKHIKVGTYHGWYLDVYVMTMVLTD